MDKTYKAAIGLRGDCLYCPLSLTIDSYWNCLVKCHHCYMRRLNRTWGEDLRPADPEDVERKLRNGKNNKNPRSSLAWALWHKKTIRLGNKTDPFQPAEQEHWVSQDILKILIKLKWSFVVQTRFVTNLQVWNSDLLYEANEHRLLSILPVISCGEEADQEILERGRTPKIEDRYRVIQSWIKKGYNVGVNGEPFIPGYHTFKQFRQTLRHLRKIGVKSYNTYNLHFNDYVATQFVEIGLDIEKIWHMNQDKEWRPIQQRLCEIANEERMILGCPDFVNTGADWKEQANTCCGITVPNPSWFTTHCWKDMLQRGYSCFDVLKNTWEGIGDKDLGEKIIKGKPCAMYTMKDAGVKEETWIR